MKQLDLQVIQQARDWTAGGTPVWLCTVLSTFGSAPRGPGAMLVALASGEHRGSLSGGCVEEDFLERLAGEYFPPHNQTVRYGAGGLAPTLALPCGGVLDVLVEYIAPGHDAQEHLAAVASALAGHRVSKRVVRFGGTERRLEPADMDTARVQVDDDQVGIKVGAVNRLILAGLSPVAGSAPVLLRHLATKSSSVTRARKSSTVLPCRGSRCDGNCLRYSSPTVAAMAPRLSSP